MLRTFVKVFITRFVNLTFEHILHTGTNRRVSCLERSTVLLRGNEFNFNLLRSRNTFGLFSFSLANQQSARSTHALPCTWNCIVGLDRVCVSSMEILRESLIGFNYS